ncbi:hypothetical protein [Pseudomonas sp. CGJS7]|uniref:hypothetical protein n=1 Tax=Pseudomonas sp. CGJS7 TaxID=3109348 RepID=UPI00300984EB
MRLLSPLRPRSLGLLAVSLLSLCLAACGGGDRAAGTDVQGDSDSTLPAPDGAGGGVTGMPDKPGPGQIGAPVEPAAGEPLLDENGNPLPGTGEAVAPVDPNAVVPDPATGAGDPATALPAEPTPEDAVAVVRDYYAAINGRQYDRAYALWSDGGRASGQNPQQFADGFAQTEGVSLELAPPGRVDAGAGQRHIEIPVSIVANQRDGSQRKYVGAYTLRRTVVDGASAEQRAWRIASADIRELKQ